MNDDWLKKLRERLGKQGFKTSAELFSLQKDDDMFSKMFHDEPNNSLFRVDKNKEEIFIENKRNTWSGLYIKYMYLIDPDITPMLESISTTMLNNEIRWMRELT